jgi:hypothetical protein
MMDHIVVDGEEIVLTACYADLPAAYSFLASLGCESPEQLERVGDQIYLSSSTQVWRKRFIPFFSSAENLWFALRNMEDEPEHYFIIGADDAVLADLKRRFKFYFSLRSMLKELCHHEGDDLQPMKYVFFTSKESHLKKLEVMYAMDLNAFMAFELSDGDILNANALMAAVKQVDDVHCDERKHVMREALVEFFKEEDGRALQPLMSNIGKFYGAYNERYKVYVSKFSVNKILSEIENERIGFLCKIQDAIMSQQTKAFAVPGGLVAVGAVLRFSKGFWDFAIIFIGLTLTTWMITSLNKTVINHIELLGDEFKKSISKYDDIIVGVENVKAEIEVSRARLNTSSAHARSRLVGLTRISWLILIVVTIMLISRSGFYSGEAVKAILERFLDWLKANWETAMETTVSLFM